MTEVLQTVYGFLEIALAFAVVVFFGYSFLCMWWYLTTEEDEARGYKKKSLSWFNYHLGKGFLRFYCVIGAMAIVRGVVVDVGLSFFGVAILVTIAALGVYALRLLRK